MSSGKIIDLDVDYASDTLITAAVAADTVLEFQSVIDFADPEDDGGWLVIAGSETTPREYTAVDEDANTLTLAEAVGEDLEAGLTVWAWDPTTLEGSKVVEYVAQVELPDEVKPVPATLLHDLVAFSDVELLRGASVRIEENEDGEWEVVEILGRQPVLDASFSTMKAEAHDAYTLIDVDVEAGTTTIPLTHTPIDESVKLVLGGVPQEPTNYTVDYDAATITLSLGVLTQKVAAIGLRVWVHYWYLRRPVVVPIPEASRDDSITADEPLIWYKFAETSGTNVDDSGSAAHDATYRNGPTLNGDYVAFDGVNDDVLIPYHAAFNDVSALLAGDADAIRPLTFEARIRTTAATFRISARANGDSGVLEFLVTTGGVLSCTTKFTTDTVTGTTPVNDGEWHDVALKLERPSSSSTRLTCQLIVDGVLDFIGLIDDPSDDPTTGMAIGSRGTTSYGVGEVADWMLYQADVPLARLLAHHEAGS